MTVGTVLLRKVLDHAALSGGIDLSQQCQGRSHAELSQLLAVTSTSSAFDNDTPHRFLFPFDLSRFCSNQLSLEPVQLRVLVASLTQPEWSTVFGALILFGLTQS